MFLFWGRHGQVGLARAEACIVKVESHSDVPDVAFSHAESEASNNNDTHSPRPLRYCKKDLRKTKRVLDEGERAENVTPMSLRPRSPVDTALDGASLGSCVDRALDTGHRGIPCLVNVSLIELHLNHMPAEVVVV